VDFFFCGTYPHAWMTNGILAGQVYTAMLGQAQNAQTYIDANERVLAENARHMQLAMYLTVAAPLVGAITWLVVKGTVAWAALVAVV
jgi:hypothetical protein